MIELSLIAWILLVLTCLIVGIHPILLKSYLLVAGTMKGHHFKKHKQILFSIAYLKIVIISFWLLGLIFTTLFSSSATGYFALSLVFGVTASIVGIFELANIFWPRFFWMRPPPRIARLISKHARSIYKFKGILKYLGWIIPTLFIYSSTLYITTIGILRLNPGQSWLIYLIASIIITIPLFAVFICVTRKINVAYILEAISNKNTTIRTIVAIALITCGWLLLMQANTTIKIG